MSTFTSNFPTEFPPSSSTATTLSEKSETSSSSSPHGEAELYESEGDSARSTASTLSLALEGGSMRINHVSVSAKLTDLQFLRDHPQFSPTVVVDNGSDTSARTHTHHPHKRHPPLSHPHSHATDPHISYRAQPAVLPLSASPTDDELSRVSQSLFGGRVVIPNAVVFQEKLAIFQDLGIDNLTVVSDFDFTLSKFTMVSGLRGASCHRVLEDCGLLSPDYHVQAQTIQRHYYPLEVDPTLDEETRVKFMIEWVEKAHALLQASGLTEEIIAQAVEKAFAEDRFLLRAHLVEFFHFLKENDVPLLVFSAGIADVVERVLRRTFPEDFEDYDVTIISNKARFDGNNSTITGFEPPVLHVFNKKASTFLEREFFKREDVATRENVLVLGDSLGDVSMTEGMGRAEPHIIRVGFLNDRLERLPQYSEVYDLVILDDPGLDVPLNIIRSIATFKMPEESEDTLEEQQQQQQQTLLM